MTKTEELLREAREIAWRAFQDPSQETIMEVFVRLCDERDCMASATERRESARCIDGLHIGRAYRDAVVMRIGITHQCHPGPTPFGL